MRSDRPRWPVPSLPTPSTAGPVLTLARCPDGSRTPCRPHWGLPGGDGDAMMKWGALVSDRGEWHLEGGAEVLSSPLALHPGRDPIGRKV